MLLDVRGFPIVLLQPLGHLSARRTHGAGRKVSRSGARAQRRCLGVASDRAGRDRRKAHGERCGGGISGGGARPDSGDLAPRMSCAGAHTSPAKPQLMVARACSRFRGQWPEGRATRLRDPRMLLSEVEHGKNFFLSCAVTGEIGGSDPEPRARLAGELAPPRAPAPRGSVARGSDRPRIPGRTSGRGSALRAARRPSA